MRRRIAVALAALVLAGCACGSTVQSQGRAGATGDELGGTGAGASAGDAGISGADGAGQTGSSDAAGGGGASSGGATGATGRRSDGSATSGGGRPGAGTAQAASPTAPLGVGVLYSDNTAAQAALGVNTNTSLSSRAVAEAVVDYYNGKGGLRGRRLEPVYHVFGADDPSYEADLQAACSDFTEDHHVAVVLDLAGAWSGSFQQCLANAKVAYLGGAISDDVDHHTFPGMANPFDRTLNDRVVTVFDTMIGTGYLTKANTLGVILEDCPHTRRVLTNTLVPAAAKRGLKIGDTFEIGCITGFASAGPGAAQLQQAVLRFSSKGVDRVTFISIYESAGLLLFAQAAEGSGYRPGYVLSSSASAANNAGSIPAAQAANMHGAGWLPTADTAQTAPTSPAGAHCLEVTRARGVVPSSPTDFSITYTGCEGFFFLDALLGVSGGRADLVSIIDAVGRLGTSYQSVLGLAGATSFRPDRHAGSGGVAPFAYQASCSCIRYTGPPERR